MQAQAGPPAHDAPLRYSVDAACQVLGISRVTLYRRIREGAIDVIKDGRRTFLSPDELVRYARREH